MALTKVINDLADLNQSGSTNALKGCAGTTAEQPASTSSIEYLIVAGGGGAMGDGSGGGGAGGLLTGITSVHHGTPTVITVGGGGKGDGYVFGDLSNGDDSGFNDIRAVGGGTAFWRYGSTVPTGPGSAWVIVKAWSGGSGGGGGHSQTGTLVSDIGAPGDGVSGQGNIGGLSVITGSLPYNTGGGGGANAVGGAGTSLQSGDGGDGTDMQAFISSTNATTAGIGEVITSAVYFAGGGGGGGNYTYSCLSGDGGYGGGGDGSHADAGNGSDGQVNTGGGAGGGSAQNAGIGGNGGSGVAILKYDNTIVTGYTLNTEDTYTINWPADIFGIAYWPLNLDVKDVGGNYNGTATDITYGSGKFNQAAVFNGSTSNIEFAAGNFANTTISFSAWIYSTSSAADQNIFCNFDYIGAISKGFIFRKDATNLLTVQLYNGAQTNLLTATTVTNSVWTHVVLTIDTTGAKIYINGGIPATLTASNAMAFHTATTRAGIGSYRYTGDVFQGFFDGSIEQARVYGSVLSATNVTDIYNNSEPSGSLPPIKVAADLTTTICNFPTGVTGTALYEFEGDADDSCTAGPYDGTFTNSAYGIGKFGPQCASFDGSTNYINVSTNSVFNADDSGTGFSLSFWINRNTTANQTPLNKEGIISGAYGWSVRYTSADGYLYDLYDTSNNLVTVSTDANSTTGTWEHVAATYNTSDSKIRIYLNGVLKDTSAALAAAAAPSADAFYIGARNTAAFIVDGLMDQVRVYPTTLTDQNVYDLWQKENSIQTYFPNSSTDTDTLVFKSGSGEITFKNDSPPGAEIGMLRYNSTLNKMEHFNSGGWKDFSYCTTNLCDYPTQANSVLLYRFNDNITDTCGTYNGVAGGSLSYNTGKFGKAINTTSGYIDTGYTLPAVSTVSVSCWIKMTSNPGADVYVMSDMNSSTDNRRLDIRIAGGSSNKLFIDNGNGSSDNQEDTGWSPTQDVWYNIVITFNGTAGILYVDGVSTYSYTSSVAVGTAGGQSEIIGRAGHYPCCNFPGLIDQFRIFTSTLTSDEVLDLYNEVQC